MYRRFVKPSPSPAPAATLCDYVESKLGMRCVEVLAAQTQLGPGAVVDFPSDAKSGSKVPLPEFGLQASCRVPGSDTSPLHPSDPSEISLPQFSYEVSRNLKEGATFDLPQLSSTTLKAGPNWKNLSRIDVTAPKAWVTGIDQIAYIENTCSIKQICVDRILAKKYRVVETSAIVEGFGYKLYDASGTEVSFDASVKKGLVASADGQEHVKQNESLTAQSPMVLAVRFLPDDVIQTRRNDFCKAPVLFTPEGSATVTLSGGGGQGAFGQQQKISGLNQDASLFAQGGESSECDGGHDRTKSSASVSAVVRAPDAQTLELERQISVHGGHYATADSCAFGGMGWSGHDTAASATAHLFGQIRITARNDGTQTLNVDYSDIPSGSSMSLTNPGGSPVNTAGGSAVGVLVGTGQLKFPINEAGVYLLRLESSVPLSTQGGAGSLQDNGVTRLKVSLDTHQIAQSQ